MQEKVSVMIACVDVNVFEVQEIPIQFCVTVYFSVKMTKETLWNCYDLIIYLQEERYAFWNCTFTPFFENRLKFSGAVISVKSFFFHNK